CGGMPVDGPGVRRVDARGGPVAPRPRLYVGPVRIGGPAVAGGIEQLQRLLAVSVRPVRGGRRRQCVGAASLGAKPRRSSGMTRGLMIRDTLAGYRDEFIEATRLSFDDCRKAHPAET